MMNNELKMLALNDDELDCVVGGFDVEHEIVDPAKAAWEMYKLIWESRIAKLKSLF